MGNSKESLDRDKESLEERKKGFLTVLFTTFSTVFLAELGDKTQLATMLLSAQSGKPLTVFIGASTALICSSLIGVLLGRWISKTMPPERFEYIAGALMVALALLLGIPAANSLIASSGVF